MYNTTLGELWLDAHAKDKIVIGVHDLECSGGVREARYRDSVYKQYDGVHMYGPSGIKAYTVSFIDTLLELDIIEKDRKLLSGSDYFRKFSQFEYQKRKQRRLNQGRYTDRDVRPIRRDSDNDVDIRPKSSLRHVDNRYTIPTYNRFNHLNW